jgi:hypothetical protein
VGGGPPNATTATCARTARARRRGCDHTDNTDLRGDASPCTTEDTCAAGQCVRSASLNCDDGNVCTDDSCDPASGCAYTDNTALRRRTFARRTTAAGWGCGWPLRDCDDGNECTFDYCNQEAARAAKK